MFVPGRVGISSHTIFSNIYISIPCMHPARVYHVMSSMESGYLSAHWKLILHRQWRERGELCRGFCLIHYPTQLTDNKRHRSTSTSSRLECCCVIKSNQKEFHCYSKHESFSPSLSSHTLSIRVELVKSLSWERWEVAVGEWLDSSKKKTSRNIKNLVEELSRKYGEGGRTRDGR